MQIIWTDAGTKSLEFLMTCARDIYSQKTLSSLYQEIKKTERQLKSNPYIGQREPLAEGREYDYRHIVLSNMFKLIYFIYEENIFIVSIWDTRQNPDLLIKKL